ncbi:hypothetical protein IJG78_01960, partial [Candidatus Saccharibacteria bacterium]|nr:hypothetical protein [Candidatus Saccharibacteria bacterium]
MENSINQKRYQKKESSLTSNRKFSMTIWPRMASLTKCLFSMHGFSRRTATITFSIFAVAFVATFLSFSIFVPINSSDATTVSTNVAYTGYLINVKSSDITIDMEASPSGQVAYARDTIVTNTNAP